MGDDQKWVHVGPKEPLPKMDAPLGLRLYRSLLHKSIDPLLINGATGESLSSAEVLQRGISFATELKTRGIGPGDVVSLALENCIEYSFIMLGTFMAGAILAPVDPKLDSNDLGHIFGMLDPKIVFNLPQLSERIKALNSNVTELVEVDNQNADWKKFIEHGNVTNFEPTVVENLDDPAVILCSSGTTGTPKGVMISHRALIYSREKHWLQPRFGEKEVYGMVSPIFWVSGTMLTLIMLDTCDQQVFFPKFEADIFLRSIEKYRISASVLPPQQLAAINKSPSSWHYDFSSLGPLVTGGSAVSMAVKEEAERILKTDILIYYGQTEALLPFVVHGPKSLEKPATVGVVGPNSSLKVADVETGTALGPNKEGEICVKLPISFSGYYRNPGAMKTLLDKEGWHHTGDVGYYDDDGYFYISDRIKELIKYKGIHISPVDIEDVLLTHPGVKDAAVAGAFHDIDQERPVGFVVKQPGATVTKEELLELVKEKLPEYKWLHGGIHFIEEIPRTSSGKILRRKLRQLAAEYSK